MLQKVIDYFDLLAISDSFTLRVGAALLGVQYILQLIWAWHNPSLGKEKRLDFVLNTQPLVEQRVSLVTLAEFTKSL